MLCLSSSQSVFKVVFQVCFWAMRELGKCSTTEDTYLRGLGLKAKSGGGGAKVFHFYILYPNGAMRTGNSWLDEMLYRKPCWESPGSKVCLEELLEYLSLSVLLCCGRCFLDTLPGKEREREECPLRKDKHLHYLGVKVNGIGKSVFPSYTL